MVDIIPYKGSIVINYLNRETNIIIINYLCLQDLNQSSHKEGGIWTGKRQSKNRNRNHC